MDTGIKNDTGFSIGRFSVTHTVLINILMITVLALGVFSLMRLPQEQFAEVPFFWVNVIVPYPGVSAEDMESSVTVPIENQFQGIDRLKQISSTTSEGLSIVRIEFDDGISNDEFRTLYQESQTRFSQVELPDDVLTPIVDDFSSADFLPVIEVVVSADQSYEVLSETAKSLRDEILKVSDVADVDIVGLPERQIILDFDTHRIESLGLSIGEILRAVQDQNSIVPGGSLTTDSREYLLRTLGSIESVDDFSDVIIRRSEEGSGIVRVSDAARVIDGFDADSTISRFNGEQSVSLRITKVPRGSSVDVVSGTRKIVEEAAYSLPVGMDLDLFNDSTVQIASSLSVLTSNALLGLGLLVLILWLFVGLRNALMTALGIPVTFALTFLVLDLLGETINTNTLFGLVLVLGLIVDHAIVIIENSYRLQQEGLPRARAAMLGTDQVVLPVIAATATTVAAFLPLMIIPGTIGKFLRVIPLTVSIALIVSTGEALFFLPNHFADWGRERPPKAGKTPGRWFSGLQRGYTRFLKAIYRRKGLILLLVLIAAAASFSLVTTLNQDLFSAEDYSYFSIDITMPNGTPSSETDRVTAAYEQVLLGRLGDGEIVSVSSSVGSLSGDTGVTRQQNVAQITVDLTEKDEGRERGIDEIIEEIRWATYSIAGPDEVLFRKAQNGPPTSAALSFRVFGDSLDDISEASERLQDVIAAFPGTSNIEDDYTPGSPELQIRMNQERASALGVTVQTLGNYVRARFEGITLGTFFENNEEIDIVLRFDSDEQESFEDLTHAMIPTDDGRSIPFSSIAEISQSTSIGTIRRLDGKREITIIADAEDSVDLEVVNEAVKEAWETDLSYLYPGAEFTVGGEFSEFQDLLADILRIFLLGVFLIYLILGTQFDSYTQPFLILLSVPFAFVGIILYLVVSGTPFSTTVLYAGVALAGIAVNDAIVLISFINEQREQGLSVSASIFEAARTRVRPIMLTSLTTIAGLLPTAIGIGGTSVVWGPMASTIIFGLIFSTLTALIIIPLLYGLLYDRSHGRKEHES